MIYHLNNHLKYDKLNLVLAFQIETLLSLNLKINKTAILIRNVSKLRLFLALYEVAGKVVGHKDYDISALFLKMGLRL